MAEKIGRNRNTNDNADVSGAIALNSSTATTVSSANDERIFFHVDNDNAANGFWVRLYPAAQDNLKQGIFVTGKTGNRSFWDMPIDNIYTGEISAISVAANPDAYVTEY